MPDERQYIELIGKYPANEHSVSYIQNNYEQRIIDGNPMELVSFYDLPSPADTYTNVYTGFMVSEEDYPYITKWSESFDFDNVYTVYQIAEGTYPYPVPYNSMNYEVFTNFQIRNSYPYAASREPEPFDPEGVYSKFIMSPNFYHQPAPWFDKKPTLEELIDWKRIEPEFLEKQIKITIYVDSTLVDSSTPIIKDRDTNREEYQNYQRRYFEAESQN